MKKIPDEQLRAVSQTHGFNAQTDLELRAIASNSFYMGAMAMKHELKQLDSKTVRQKARKYSKECYYSSDRQEIAERSYVAGAAYMFV